MIQQKVPMVSDFISDRLQFKQAAIVISIKARTPSKGSFGARDYRCKALTRHKVSLLGIISAKWLWCFFMSIFTLMKMNVTHWQNITRNMVCNSQSGFGQLAKQAWGWVSQLQCFWSGIINAKTKISPISTLWGWWTDLLSLLGCEVRIRKGTESGLHRRRGVV